MASALDAPQRHPPLPRLGWRDQLGSLLALDLRSLAVFRVGLASAVLYDTLDRWQDLVAHYTDLGVLPVSTLVALYGPAAYASPFVWVSGSPALVGLLFAALALSALALGAGWRTRWAAVLCWALLVALQARNPFSAAMGGDKLLRILLFWSLFLPMGARGSLDALRDGGLRQYSNRLVGIPGAVLLLQLCVMYWVTGWLKSGETWLDGTALTYALNLDLFVSPLGLWLRELPALHPFLTHGTRWFELLAPFLAFVPWVTGPARCLTILMFVGFHLGLALFLYIGPFPLFCIVAWMAFLPAWFWDQLLPRLRGRAFPEAAPASAREPIQIPAWAQLTAGLLFVLAIAEMGGRMVGIGVPGAVAQATRALRIQQTWSMFAPDPLSGEFWPVFHGHLEDGKTIDPLRNEPVMTRKPRRVSASFPSFRWRIYFTYMPVDTTQIERSQRLFFGLADYLCRDWNTRHVGPQAMRRLEIEYWVEDNRDFSAPIDRATVFYHHCVPEGPG